MVTKLAIKCKIRQYAVAGCVGSIYIGNAFSWSSPVVPRLENSPLKITIEEASWIGSILSFGAIAAAVPSGYVADRFGRKFCTLALMIPIIIFTALVCVGSNVYYIYVARIFSGISTGGLSAIAPIYMSEIADIEIRASMNSLFQALIYLGIFMNAVLGKYLDYIPFTIVTSAIGIVLILSFLLFPESPTFLMQRNNRKAAEQSIMFFRGDCDVKRELDDISKALEAKKETKANFWTIWRTKAAIRSLVATAGILFFQVMSGVDVLIFYSVSVFQTAGTNLDPNLSSIYLSSAQVLSCFFAVNVIEKFNRKTFLYISILGIISMLLLLGIFFELKKLGFDSYLVNLIPLISTVLFFVFYLTGLGPIPWLITGELIPTDIRGPASGICTMVCWTVAFIVTKTYPLMVNAFEPQYTFYFYACFMSLSLFFVKYLIPETKGQTLQEIQEKLSR